MASRATELLKSVEDRLPAPLARQFGTPAAAAWTAVFVLVAAFALINYGVGVVLDSVLHPAPEEAPATAEPVGTPASVVVALPPPLAPKIVPAAVVPAAPLPAAAPQRPRRWESRSYRHGWGSRRGRERTGEPAAQAAPVSAEPRASHNPSPTNLLLGGLPKHLPTIAQPATPKPLSAAAPSPAQAASAPKAGPPASLSSSAPN
jgi:hypothetical protein